MSGYPIILGGRRARSYSNKLLNTQRANLISYWPQWELTGTNIENLAGTTVADKALRDGTFTGVTLGQPGIGDGRTAPLYDGVNDFGDIYSASLNALFNGSEGTLLSWFLVSGGGVWSDSTLRRIVRIAAHGGMYISIHRSTVNNQIIFEYNAAGTLEQIGDITAGNDWILAALTWSATSDEVKAYRAGLQTGATSTGLGVWGDPLGADIVKIGATNSTPAAPWDGYLAHTALWTTPLTAAEILNLSKV